MPDIEIKRGTPTKCHKCLRTKEQALRYHLEKMEICDAIDCPFKYDIIDAIEMKRHPKITIKGVKNKFPITIKEIK